MLNKLIIKNFKLHKSAELDLCNLTILTGQNSSGKSSILQALLLLRQSYLQGNIAESLQLQGELCNIGLVDEAICQYGDDDTIEFSVGDENDLFSWKFGKKDSSGFKDMMPIIEHGKNIPSEDNFRRMSLFNNHFQYISASRIGPRESYPLNTTAAEIKGQLSSELGLCDLVVHFLYHKGTEEKFLINKELSYDGIDLLGLNDQVSAWERVISTGVNVSAQQEGKSFVLKYSYTKKGEYIPTKEYSATNVGYGLSYALPIIVALLTSQPGNLVIIENPEIHLHPQGQAALAKLIARAAQLGVQVIVETHSDHIINGILVAAKQYENGEKGIDRNSVKIYQCAKSEETQLAEISEIKIVEDGKIDCQPEGFFDQTDKDLRYLMGF